MTYVHDKIKSKVLNEEVGVVSQGLSIECVQDSMTSSISSSGASVCLATFAVFQRLTTKSTLVDLAFFGTGEGDTEVLEFDDGAAIYKTYMMSLRVLPGGCYALTEEPRGTCSE